MGRNSWSGRMGFSSVLVVSLVFILIEVGVGVEASPLPEPSSAWRQPALAINTINPGNENKGKNTNGKDGKKEGSGSGRDPSLGPERKKTYTWNTIMHYGLSGADNHKIRHKPKKIRDHSKLPCPFDQIRSWWDGKCRPAPRFSLYRVG